MQESWNFFRIQKKILFRLVCNLTQEKIKNDPRKKMVKKWVFWIFEAKIILKLEFLFENTFFEKFHVC